MSDNCPGREGGREERREGKKGREGGREEGNSVQSVKHNSTLPPCHWNTVREHVENQE